MAPLADTKMQWSFPLSSVLSDRSGPRTSCPADRASGLLGFDLNDTGGLRPFPGFRMVKTLDPAANEDVGSEHGETSVVTDFFPIDIREGDSDYAYGFIYRVKRADGLSSDVIAEWWHSGDAVWHSSLIADDIRTDGIMSVVSWGRLAFVYVQGERPRVFSTVEDSMSLGDWVAGVTDAGPGVQPTCIVDAGGSPSVGTAHVQFDGTGDSGPPASVALQPGEYGFAYELYDSRTGQRSGISTIAQVTVADFSAAAKHVKLVVGVSVADWDRIHLYRSVMLDDAGGTFTAAIMQLDRIVEVGSSTVTCWYTLQDRSLIFQKTYQGYGSFDESAPFGGAAAILNGCMIVSAIENTPESVDDQTTIQDEYRNVGEIRWSSPSEIAPELFSPLARHVPKVSTSEALAIVQAGPVALGLGDDRIFHIRKSNAYVTVEEMHEGHGIVGPKAVCSLGDTAYFMGRQGIKGMSPDASLNDIQVADDIVRRLWGDLSEVAMAHDPAMQVIFALHPGRGEAICLWLRAGRMGELSDLPFDCVATGAWPRLWEDSGDDGNKLERRALFLQNFPAGSDPIEGWKPRVYVVDMERSRTVSGTFGSVGAGQPRVTLLDVTGDVCFITEAEYNDAAHELTLTTDDRLLGDGLIGAKVYVTGVEDPADNAYVGKSATIVGFDTAVLVLSDDADFVGLPEDSTVAVSPVHARWTSACVGAGQMDGQEGMVGGGRSDFMSVRQVESVRVAFEGVSGPPTASVRWANVWVGGLWKGNGEEAAVAGWPVDGEGAALRSVADGPSPVAAAFGVQAPRGNALAVSVETFCPDLDYRLLGAVASGKILATQRLSIGS